MQILMGAHATIVSIDESKIYTKNLLYFIQTNLNSYTKHKNSIILNHSQKEHYERVFLLKWLYTLHTKVTKQNVPNLKELLVKRVDKPIKIEFKNRIEKQLCINVEIVEENILKLSLNKNDFYLFSDFKTIIEKQINNFSIRDKYIEMILENDLIIDNLKTMFSYKTQKKHNIFFIYQDKNKLNELLNPHPINNIFEDALIILDVKKEDSIQSIKIQYKKLLKIYHPDNVFQKNNEIEYTQKFQTIQNAYTVIKEQLSS